ncbi:MAG TPA: thiamine phosphate synthase, partial [Solirubrobacteraceae bacterium]
MSARTTAARVAPAGVLLILNDRPDLVVAAGADGVHVGQDDTPVDQARELVGPHRLVG